MNLEQVQEKEKADSKMVGGDKELPERPEGIESQPLLAV